MKVDPFKNEPENKTHIIINPEQKSRVEFNDKPRLRNNGSIQLGVPLWLKDETKVEVQLQPTSEVELPEGSKVDPVFFIRHKQLELIREIPKKDPDKEPNNKLVEEPDKPVELEDPEETNEDPEEPENEDFENESPKSKRVLLKKRGK